MEVVGVREQSVEPSHDCVQTFRLVDRHPAAEVFDIEENGGCLVQIVDHVVDGRTVCRRLVAGAQELGIWSALHGRTALSGAEVLEGGGQQVQLQHELTDMLVLPDVDVDADRFVDNAFDVGRVVA
jgi:hypothetical protein